MKKETGAMRNFKHLSFGDRLKIEVLVKAGHSVKEIAQIIEVHISTIYRELKRGVFVGLNPDYTTEERYSPDIADEKYRDHLKAKGTSLKIGNDITLANYIEKKIIKDDYSLAAVLGKIRRDKIPFTTSTCVTTLYSY